MRHKTIVLTLLGLFLAGAQTYGADSRGYALNVLVGDNERPELNGRGTVYVEAVRGRSYSLRISNPTGQRVAVALSVDGLNTIDSRHTDSWDASKWVIEPYGSTVISGWQVNQKAARRFFFTGENRSYGAALGQTDNLGVIEAVFYRERRPRMTSYQQREEDGMEPESSSKAERKDSAPSGMPRSAAAPPAAQEGGLSDDYAGTGMGRRTQHQVESVDIDLEREPVASVRIRYEFRPQLVKLGLLPSSPSPLERRERARGFEGYCPEP
jgi:hypothetical protein